MPTCTVAHGAEMRCAALVSLIRSEYLEMPGLSVTLPQAARLWNAERGDCLDALETLVRDRFLRKSAGMYLKATGGPTLM